MPTILAAKLHRPPTPPKRVARPHLARRLDEGLKAGRRVTLVSAPAGFGKTTAASEWAAGLGLPVAWLSLDPSDDEPGRFFTYLIAALQTVDPAIGSEVEGVLRAGQIPPAEALSASLANDILAVEQRFVLVLDDFQVIQHGDILQVVEQLIANPLEALHLALLSREDPSLPLARLRANNLLTELRLADLRFGTEDTARFLNKVMGLALSHADVQALEERTEGWIAGLQLAALAVQAQGEAGEAEASALITHLSGSHRYILSYLTEEVLNRQPEDVRRFLLQTSILDRLNGSLCDALTGRSDSRELLEQLYHANLFLTPLDEAHHWYRYHTLFAGMLRDLLHTQPKESLTELHRRAGRWYAQASQDGGEGGGDIFPGQAIQHALAAKDYATVVQMLDAHALDMLMQWHVKTVEGWLQAIPAEWAMQSPKTNLAFAWMHLQRRDPAQAMPYIERLQSTLGGFTPASPEGPSDPAVQAEWLVLQATLLNAQGQPEQSVALTRQALEIAPQPGPNLASLIYTALAGAYQQMGDIPAAEEAYLELIRLGRAAGDITTEVLGVSALGLLLIQRGELQACFELALPAVERVERLGTLMPVSAALYGELGQIYYDWHDLENAHRYFTRAMQVSSVSGYSDAELYYAVILSRLYHMQGDLEAAAREVQRAVGRMQEDAPAAVREEIIAQQVRIALAQGRLAAAEAALQGQHARGPGMFSAPPPSTDEQIAPQEAVLHNSALRILLHRARERGEVEGLEAGIALAGRLIEGAMSSGYVPTALESLLLRSQMYTIRGDEAAGLDDVARAVELGEPGGYITRFLQEGPAVTEALEALRRQKRPEAGQERYVEAILAAFGEARPPRQAGKAPTGEEEGLVAPLSEREVEVLRLMAGGLTYAEMADRLFISLNTVRSHVKAIYAKLNVDNRTRAIEKGQRLGVL